MKRQVIAILLLIIMITGLLCACKKDGSGNAGTEPTGTVQQAPERLEATITLGHKLEGKALETVTAHLAKFQERHPGVQVNMEQVDQITADSHPNVLIALPGEVAGFQKEGLLAPADGWIDSKSMLALADGTITSLGLTANQKEDLVSIYYEEGNQFGDDATYMLPMCKETLLVYFNQTYFEENGLDIPLSWERIEVICEQIKQNNPDAVPLACNDEAALFISLCAQYGAEYAAEGAYTFNDGEVRAAMKKFNEWCRKGYLTTSTQAGKDLTLSQGFYMVIASSADADLQCPPAENEAYGFEVNVLPLPMAEAGEPKALAQGPGVVIFNTDDDDQMLASWLLMKYLSTEPAFQVELAIEGAYMPVLVSVDTDETYSAFLDSADGGENVQGLAALSCMEQAHTLFTVPPMENAGAAKEQVAALFNTCLTITEDVDAQIEAAFQAAEDACNNG